jgi:O-antigen/teichoic acid export membrane protein
LNLKSVAGFSAFPSNFNKISLYSLAGTLVTTVGQYADFYILDHFAMNREQIGHYSLAFLFVLGASQVTGTIQTIASPYFTAKSSDEAWFRKKLSDVQWKVCLLSVAVAVSVWCVAWLLVRNFFDLNYAGSMNYLAVLLIKYVVWSAYSIIGVALVGIGLIRSGFYLSLLTTPLVIGLGYMLLRDYGVIGVAWAQVIVAVFSGLCILLIARVELNRYFSAVDRDRLV